MRVKKKRSINLHCIDIRRLSRKCKRRTGSIKDISYDEFDLCLWLRYAFPIGRCNDNESITFELKQIRLKREMSHNYSYFDHDSKKTLEQRSHEIN